MTLLLFSIYYASVMLYAFIIYYAQNYTGIIGKGLDQIRPASFKSYRGIIKIAKKKKDYFSYIKKKTEGKRKLVNHKIKSKRKSIYKYKKLK